MLVGGARHLAMVPHGAPERLSWERPIARTLDALSRHRGRRVVVLASGDPLWFGIGRLILRRLPAEEVEIIPNLSAFQWACCRLGWALEEVAAVSLHGRPIERLRRHLAPGVRLLLLTGSGEDPPRIAALLQEEGLGRADMWVMERLGGAERIWHGRVREAPGRRFDELNLVALALPRDVELPRAALVPGREEELFLHDGLITKAEVRAATLARLRPQPGQLLWDVGAGSGAVAIEWLRAGSDMRATAVEQRAERVARIRENARAFGVPELVVIHGRAPEALREQTAPDAVFIGGGLEDPELVACCYERLRPCGRLVANAVTPAGEESLLYAWRRFGGSLYRLQVSRAEPAGGTVLWRAQAPVTQLLLVKPA